MSNIHLPTFGGKQHSQQIVRLYISLQGTLHNVTFRIGEYLIKRRMPTQTPSLPKRVFIQTGSIANNRLYLFNVANISSVFPVSLLTAGFLDEVLSRAGLGIVNKCSILSHSLEHADQSTSSHSFKNHCHSFFRMSHLTLCFPTGNRFDAALNPRLAPTG
jgi:hypothetical protein